MAPGDRKLQKDVQNFHFYTISFDTSFSSLKKRLLNYVCLSVWLSTHTSVFFTFSLALSLILSISLSRCSTLTVHLTLSVSLNIYIYIYIYIYISFSHSHIFGLSLSYFDRHTHAHTHTNAHFLNLTYTHSLSLSLSLSPFFSLTLFWHFIFELDYISISSSLACDTFSSLPRTSIGDGMTYLSVPKQGLHLGEACSKLVRSGYKKL